MLMLLKMLYLADVMLFVLLLLLLLHAQLLTEVCQEPDRYTINKGNSFATENISRCSTSKCDNKNKATA